MEATFYLSALIALAATLRVVTAANAVHALLYLVVSLLAVALVFFVLGAPFAAALEVIIYAGAIVVLFVFVVMMLNLGEEAEQQERSWLRPGIWWGPGLLAALLFIELVLLLTGAVHSTGGAMVAPKAVGIALYGPYLLAVELGAFLLLGGLVGAYHLGRQEALEGDEDG
ncbi:NADH dehydrogenase [Thiohalorhabdus denitrificans]|uniref:NADH-quinone oxidoreductase subunit J n=1 Tax=Thiohalorhabdus denitrificans TaxID=381306 RepID=A0A0P9CC37_9GAMM|nr:NADH-quinone oxidoreductase subunit J [Thiohalorhabdus denitrificans]KPV40494.1 NADH dehydrogenase [Thiohalorhabdus denitrificans]SCY62323.1 NADH dehydrogenase subunit J [Thiohalorhabdus denitrificans]